MGVTLYVLRKNKYTHDKHITHIYPTNWSAHTFIFTWCVCVWGGFKTGTAQVYEVCNNFVTGVDRSEEDDRTIMHISFKTRNTQRNSNNFLVTLSVTAATLITGAHFYTCFINMISTSLETLIADLSHFILLLYSLLFAVS